MDLEQLIGKNWSAIRQVARVPGPVPAECVRAGDRMVRPLGMGSALVRVGAAGWPGARDPRALVFLFEHCGDAPAWQVNEALAMAFDDYCAALGYEQAILAMQQWLQAPQANLRRAVSEGLRPWTAGKRAVFAGNPQLAINLLGTLKDDPSRYVQESVGNALRDISRKHFGLVLAALRAWLAEQPQSQARRTIAKFALEKAVKEDPSLRELYA
jgi:3-methyladenine DNA glycosylase AlkC